MNNFGNRRVMDDPPNNENDDVEMDADPVFETIDSDDTSTRGSSPEVGGYLQAIRRPYVTTPPLNATPQPSAPEDDNVELHLPEPVELKSKTRLSLTIKALHVTAEWKWIDGKDDTCGICRMPFESCCVDCRYPGDECPLVVGSCRHPFHRHCIEKWSTSASRAQCPMCRQDWRPSTSVQPSPAITSNREGLLAAIRRRRAGDI